MPASMPPPLPRFGDARVLIAGDVMLDRYWRGDSDAHLARGAGAGGARAGGRGPARRRGQRRAERGRARRAGDAARAGRRRRGGGRAAGAARGGRHRSRAPPGSRMRAPSLKLRVLSRHQQLLRLDLEARSAHGRARAARARCGAQLPAAQVLVLSDYAKGTLAEPRRRSSRRRARRQCRCWSIPRGTTSALSRRHAADAEPGRVRGGSRATASRARAGAAGAPAGAGARRSGRCWSRAASDGMTLVRAAGDGAAPAGAGARGLRRDRRRRHGDRRPLAAALAAGATLADAVRARQPGRRHRGRQARHRAP